MSNYINNQYTEINDLSQIYCNTLNTSTITNDELNALQGISTVNTIQEQINAIIYGNNPGGYFSITATQNSGFIANSYWGFNSGTNPIVNIPLVYAYPFRIIGIVISCQSTPTSATVRIIKNGTDDVYEMTDVNSTLNTFQGLTIDFNAFDTFNIFTVTGAGGGLVRMTISCEVEGVVGPVGPQGPSGASGQNGITPNFTIGTVTNLASGSTPTVTLSGTQAYPSLNFGLVQGPQGPQGPQGSQGQKGDKGDKGDTDATGLASGLLALGASGISSILSALGLSAVTADIGTLQGQVSGLEGDVSTLNDEVSALEGKTQYITTDTATVTTQITSNFQVGGTNNPSNFKIDFATGKLDNRGDITVRNSTGGSTITLSNADGAITGNKISCTNGNIDAITTSDSQTQNIFGSTVNIGTNNSNTTINIGNSTSNINMDNKLTIKGVTKDITLEEGSIVCADLTSSTININNASQSQVIDGSTITIGHTSNVDWTRNYIYGDTYLRGGTVYLQAGPNSAYVDVPLIPWSPASSFFSQW
jgi:hypothetical protein